jgi:hypothetical protein
MKKLLFGSVSSVALSIALGIALVSPLAGRTALAQTAVVYTDLWSNTLEPGWGINLNHQSDIIFGTWFTYSANNAANWTVMDALRRQADGSFTGTVYQTTGTVFNQINGAPAVKSTVAVGTATLRFTGAAAGTFTYTINGSTQTKNITRQQYTTTPTTCVQVPASTSRAASQNYQDLWNLPAESGWGVNITHQTDTLFATWFTYRADGSAQWLVASDVARQADGSFTGILYRTTGIAFNLINGAKSSLTTVPVGNIKFVFANGENGVMSYTLDGVSGSKNIVRQVFGNTVNSCTNPASTISGSNPPPTNPAGQCLGTLDFTQGSTYVMRTSVTGTAPTESQTKVLGPGTYQGRAVTKVEIRPITNGVVSTTESTVHNYEEKGDAIGIIATESNNSGGITLQTYDPVDYFPKVVTVGQTLGGTYTATTNTVNQGITAMAKTVYTYSGKIANAENITVPAGTFNSACKFLLDRAEFRITVSISAFPVPTTDYTCVTNNATSHLTPIGSVRSAQPLGECQGVGAPVQQGIVQELIRATVGGKSYP